MVRVLETAAASLAAIFERRRLGMAIAATMRMMATTISISIMVKPRDCREHPVVRCLSRVIANSPVPEKKGEEAYGFRPQGLLKVTAELGWQPSGCCRPW